MKNKILVLTPGRLGYLPSNGKLTDNADWMPLLSKRKLFLSNVLMKTHVRMQLPKNEIWYSWRKRLYQYDTVIIFDTALANVYSNYIIDRYPNIRIIIWYSNPVCTTIAPAKFNKQCELWSFDKNDCNKYGMKWNTQFYCSPFEGSNERISSDICFVGQDKGRREQINNVAHICQENNLKTDFIIVDNPKLIHLNIRNKYIPYEDIVRSHYLHSRAILDVVQQGQQGLTLRPLECLFLNKKLITNNSDIVNYDFYRMENQLVINDFADFDGRLLRDFLESNECCYDQSLKHYYSAECWINRFLL